MAIPLNLFFRIKVSIEVTGLADTNSVSFANGTDTLTVDSNGSAVLSIIGDGMPFNVSITNQPDTPAQICAFTNANSGTIASADVTITVECVTQSYDINIDVTGLADTNSVSFANGTDTITVDTNGSVVLSTLLDGTSFNASITSQPDTPAQICAFTNANSGTIASADVTITVECVTQSYDINIDVTGLADTNSVSFANGTDTLTVDANGSVVLSTLLDGTPFNASITSQPDTPNQICTFTNVNSGTIASADVTLTVECVTQSYTIGGMVDGLLDGNSLTIQNNLTDALVIANNGSFVFDTALIDESKYDVTVATPANNPIQTCDINNGNGSISGMNITSITIICSASDDLIFRNGFEEQIP